MRDFHELKASEVSRDLMCNEYGRLYHYGNAHAHHKVSYFTSLCMGYGELLAVFHVDE